MSRRAPVVGGLGYLAWPGCYAGSVALTLGLVATGLSPELSVAATTVVLALLFFAAERLHPLRHDWREGDGQGLADVLHFVFGFTLGTGGGALLAVALFAAPGSWLDARLGLWPHHAPLPVQVVLALLLSELGLYGQHRLVHRVPWLWRFHALHHNPRRLVFVKAARIHALDIGPATFLSLTPLVLLGVRPEVLVWLTLMNNVSGLVQHSNVPLPTLRVFDYLVSTPKVHRSHHARDLVMGNRNFSMNLMLLDHLFGTFAAPTDDAPAAVGMDDDDGQSGFVAETLAPFRRR